MTAVDCAMTIATSALSSSTAGRARRSTSSTKLLSTSTCNTSPRGLSEPPATRASPTTPSSDSIWPARLRIAALSPWKVIRWCTAPSGDLARAQDEGRKRLGQDQQQEERRQREAPERERARRFPLCLAMRMPAERRPDEQHQQAGGRR